MAKEMQRFDDTMTMEELLASAEGAGGEGRIITGEVVSVDKQFVYVSIGQKNEGRVAVEEFTEVPAVGSELRVSKQSHRVIDGYFSLSVKAAFDDTSWQNFLTAYQPGQDVISGTVESTVNKGAIVRCAGVAAFFTVFACR